MRMALFVACVVKVKMCLVVCHVLLKSRFPNARANLFSIFRTVFNFLCCQWRQKVKYLCIFLLVICILTDPMETVRKHSE